LSSLEGRGWYKQGEGGERGRGRKEKVDKAGLRVALFKNLTVYKVPM
jgi:hypothetical protein